MLIISSTSPTCEIIELNLARDPSAQEPQLLKVRGSPPGNRVPSNNSREAGAGNLRATTALTSSDVVQARLSNAVDPWVHEAEWRQTVGDTVAVQKSNDGGESRRGGRSTRDELIDAGVDDVEV